MRGSNTTALSEKRFTIFVLTYHEPRDLSGTLIFERCVDSILRTAPGDKFHLYIGLNEPTETVKKRADKYLDEGAADLVVDSPRNICKEGMYSILMDRLRTEFVIRVDDDTHFLAPWLDELEEEIAYDTKRQVAEWGRVQHFVPICEGVSKQSALGVDDVKKQSWYRDKPLRGVPSCSGGFVCSRVEALRAVGYPHNNFAPIFEEDNILGMALWQQGWLLRNIPLAWNRDILMLGDEEGFGSRTDRQNPRPVWDECMDGITVKAYG
ncbi:MAG TPA: hypothetical protein VFA55_09335 [Candidatus Kapabacteria bacterium]|nr:hypothetical protein [Candidatus Kapabacteria bacterium]